MSCIIEGFGLYITLDTPLRNVNTLKSQAPSKGKALPNFLFVKGRHGKLTSTSASATSFRQTHHSPSLPYTAQPFSSQNEASPQSAQTMFCASLRRRPSFSSCIPNLQTNPYISLRGRLPVHLSSTLSIVRTNSCTESSLETHDVALPLTSTSDPRSDSTLNPRKLRGLLLSRSCIEQETLAATIQRIQHFAALTGGQYLVIIFLLAPCVKQATTKGFISAKDLADSQNASVRDPADVLAGITAYTTLQATLATRQDILHIPILPLTSLDALPRLLQSHIAARNCPPPRPEPAATTFDLLKLCTASPPMPVQTAYVLNDLFGSIGELAAACTTAASAPCSSSPTARLAKRVEGCREDDPLSCDMSALHSSATLVGTSSSHEALGKLKKLRDLIGDRQTTDVVDFWRDEWTLE